MTADRLPAVPDDDLIVEGEIVDDDEPAPQRPAGTALAIVSDRRGEQRGVSDDPVLGRHRGGRERKTWEAGS